MADHTTPNEETRETEAQQARMTAEGGPEPTEDEEKTADGFAMDAKVAGHEKEMLERGAHQQGEGQLP